MNTRDKLKNDLVAAVYPHCYTATDAYAAVNRILTVLSKYPPLQESFNQIDDLRGFLLYHPNGEMITNSCLHFLGDEAQEWWANKVNNLME